MAARTFGGGIIAGLPLETFSEGAVQSIVNSFGVYGIGHLQEAVVVWLVVFRYRQLIPLVLAFLLASQALGVVLLAWKPLPVTPPGEIAVHFLLPLSLGFFLLSIKAPKRSADRR